MQAGSYGLVHRVACWSLRPGITSLLRQTLPRSTKETSPSCRGFTCGTSVDAVVVGAVRHHNLGDTRRGAGAGVVGLAAARALALTGHEVVVLEAARAVGTGSSSRNSEVVHSGIYYPTGSLKARYCVEGRQRLYEYCDSRGVPYSRLGKLLVATTEEEVPKLEALQQKAVANGVTNLQWLDAETVKEMEPALKCTAALLSPSTGIVDSHSLMLAYQGDAESHGAVVALNSRVRQGRVGQSSIQLDIEDTTTGEVTSLEAAKVVNSAGLHAQEVARSVQGLPEHLIPPQHYARGCYFTLAGKAPFSHLIYPMPHDGGLGVHLTLDLAQQARFGPDVEWVDSIDYTVDPSRAERFYSAIRLYYPSLPDGALQPSYSGIRAKVAGQGEPNGDFIIQGPEDHGVAGLVNLFGIESPGLTSSLVIGKRCAQLLGACAS